MSAGSSRSRFGVIIGLPFSFQYDNVDTASDKPVISVRPFNVHLAHFFINKSNQDSKESNRNYYCQEIQTRKSFFFRVMGHYIKC